MGSRTENRTPRIRIKSKERKKIQEKTWRLSAQQFIRPFFNFLCLFFLLLLCVVCACLSMCGCVVLCLVADRAEVDGITYAPHSGPPHAHQRPTRRWSQHACSHRCNCSRCYIAPAMVHGGALWCLYSHEVVGKGKRCCCCCCRC